MIRDRSDRRAGRAWRPMSAYGPRAERRAAAIRVGEAALAIVCAILLALGLWFTAVAVIVMATPQASQ